MLKYTNIVMICLFWIGLALASDIDSSESLSTCEYEKAMEEYDRDVKKSLEDSEKRTEELIEKYRSKSTYTNQ